MIKLQEGNAEKLAVIISVSLHLLAAVVLFSISYTINTSPMEKLIEVINYGVEKPLENGNNIQKPSGMQKPQASQQTGSKSGEAPQQINLPKTISQSDEQILTPSQELSTFSNLQSSSIAGNTHHKAVSGLSQPALSEDITPPQETAASVKANSDFLADLRKKAASADSNPGGYSIGGEISSRKVIKEVLPQYPDGLQRNSQVVLSFSVMPNGSVDPDIVITQKGGSELDRISVNALQQWKFNPISGEHVQTGTITFRYKLK